MSLTNEKKPRRKLRFGAFMNLPSSHPTGWRHPDAVPETDLSFAHLADMARIAEHGKLDAMFFQDSAAVPGSSALYGGKPLGEAPANSGEGWTSATFAGWLK